MLTPTCRDVLVPVGNSADDASGWSAWLTPRARLGNLTPCAACWVECAACWGELSWAVSLNTLALDILDMMRIHAGYTR